MRSENFTYDYTLSWLITSEIGLLYEELDFSRYVQPPYGGISSEQQYIEQQVDERLLPKFLDLLRRENRYACEHKSIYSRAIDALESQRTQYNWDGMFALALGLGVLAQTFPHALVLLHRLKDHDCVPLSVGAGLALMYCGEDFEGFNIEGFTALLKIGDVVKGVYVDDTDTFLEIPLKMYVRILAGLKSHVFDNQDVMEAFAAFLDRNKVPYSKKDIAKAETLLFLAESNRVNSIIFPHLLKWMTYDYYYLDDVDDYYERGLICIANMIGRDEELFDQFEDQVVAQYSERKDISLCRTLLHIKPEKSRSHVYRCLDTFFIEGQIQPQSRATVFEALVNFANSKEYRQWTKPQVLKHFYSDDPKLLASALEGLSNCEFVDEEMKKRVLALADPAKRDDSIVCSAIKLIGDWALVDDTSFSLVKDATVNASDVIAEQADKTLEILDRFRNYVNVSG